MQFLELVTSSAAGAALQASRSYENVKSTVVVFLTGWALAFFTAEDVKAYLEDQFGLVLQLSAVAFLLAYLGTPALVRVNALIDSVRFKGM